MIVNMMVVRIVKIVVERTLLMVVVAGKCGGGFMPSGR